MSQIPEVFKDAVIFEINSLRDNLTEEQKSKLDIAKYNPFTVRGCIYGLLADDCFSVKALVLLSKHSKPIRYVKYIDDIHLPINSIGRGTVNQRYFTAMEILIAILPIEKSIEVLQYIKGDVVFDINELFNHIIYGKV